MTEESLMALVDATEARTVRMRAYDYADIRKLSRGVFDMETSADLLKEGVQGYAFNATIVTHRSVPAGLFVAEGPLGKAVYCCLCGAVSPGGDCPADDCVVARIVES